MYANYETVISSEKKTFVTPQADLDVFLCVCQTFLHLLTRILPVAIIVPYANSLDQGETPSNSASHTDPSCLTMTLFSQTFSDFEAH